MKDFRGFLGIFVVLTMVATSHAQSFLTNGLVAWYKFNGNANDSSGNANNGTVVGATLTSDRFNNPNSAYAFNGNSAAVDLAPTTFNNLTAGTITAWVDLSENTQDVVFAKQHDGANTYGLFSVGEYIPNNGGPAPGPAGELYFHARNNTDPVASSTLLSTGVWHQVAVTFSTTNCNLFIDGSLSGSASGDFSIPNDASGITSIGDWGGNGAIGTMGAIDDVRIYNRALTTNEVSQLYAIESTPPLTITQDLTNSYVINGQNITLSIVATGTGPLSYQWYFNGTNDGGQAGAYAQTAGNFVYGAVVTNGGYGYGNIPNVNFIGGGGSGASGYATVSNAVVIGITVTNAGYGYSSLPAVVIDAPDGFLFGQTNSTLTISNAGQNSLGNYFVVVSNGNFSDTSSVANLTLLYPPSIAGNPVGFTQPYHTGNTLSVVGAGTPPLSYQWSLNNTNIFGATNSTLPIASLNLTNTGAYVAEVSNPYGNAYSSPADVNMSPTLTSPFTGAIGLWGQSVGLNVGAIGTGTLNYQWYFNSQPISGANSSTYALNSIQFTNAGLYSVVVSSVYGSVTNTAYQVVVNPATTSIGTCPEIYISGTVGYSYTIQSSTDLTDTNSWVTLTNITLGAASEIWADTATDITKSANPKKFYRVLPGQ